MSGVEILATEKVVSETAFNWIAFWLLFSTIFISLLVGAILALRDGCKSASIGFICTGLVSGFIIGGLFGAVFSTPIAYKNQYKVTVSDEVSMNKFYERYEIIDQEGKIYTVEEREN